MGYEGIMYWGARVYRCLCVRVYTYVPQEMDLPKKACDEEGLFRMEPSGFSILSGGKAL